MGNLYRIRKTGEIVEVISYYSDSIRSEALDYVSYIDSSGVEHDREYLNLYWDMEKVEEDTKFNKQVDNTKEIDWEQRRYEIAKSVAAGILASSIDFNSIPKIVAHSSVVIANALVNKLKGKKQ